VIIARLNEPGTELYTVKQWYPKTALPDLQGLSEKRTDNNRLYRSLNQILLHKDALGTHLKNRLGDLFDLKFDLPMDDVNNSYF
jgi:hypothetical protein